MNDPIISALADPFVPTGALAIFGAAAADLIFRDRPRFRLAGRLALLAALTGLLLSHGIAPYQPGPDDASWLGRFSIGAAKFIWWGNAAWVFAGFVRAFLVLNGAPRQGRLIQDIVIGVIHVGVAIAILTYVFAIPIVTLVATSGVFAIVLGLAMQSTLSDVFSGIALSLGRPYAIGDYLSIGGEISGRVMETNWRATHLINDFNDLVILPNSDLAKARITNLSGPDRAHGATVSVRLATQASPEIMAQTLRLALLSTNLIRHTPEPNVQIVAMDERAVEFGLSFTVSDLGTVGKAQNEVFDLIFRHAKAAGLNFAAPRCAADVGVPRGAGETLRSTPLRLLDAIPLFTILTEEEKQALATTMSRHTYRKGEALIQQGQAASGLVIIRSGAAVVTNRRDDRERELERLAPGDFVGERGLLTGAAETVTVRALTFVVVYSIAKEGLAPLLQDRPNLVDGFSAQMQRHGGEESDTTSRLSRPHEMSSLNAIALRIRELFNVPHESDKTAA